MINKTLKDIKPILDEARERDFRESMENG